MWIVITTLLKQQIEWWPKTFAQYCTSQSNVITTHFLSSKMVLNVSFDIEKPTCNGFESFQYGQKIALMSMIMGLINHFLSIFLLPYTLSKFQMVTVDCLGHNKFNLEVSQFIFHAQVHITGISLNRGD